MSYIQYVQWATSYDTQAMRLKIHSGGQSYSYFVNKLRK